MSTDGILVCRESLLCALRFDSIYKCGVKWFVLVPRGRRFLRGAGWGDGERGVRCTESGTDLSRLLLQVCVGQCVR